jgi:hypothetical protein
MLRRVRVSVRIAGLVVFGPGHTRHLLYLIKGGESV